MKLAAIAGAAFTGFLWGWVIWTAMTTYDDKHPIPGFILVGIGMLTFCLCNVVMGAVMILRDKP